jgi:hypothetical protein
VNVELTHDDLREIESAAAKSGWMAHGILSISSG